MPRRVRQMGWELGVEPLALDLALTPAQQYAEYPKSRYGPPGYWEGRYRWQAP